MRTEVTTVTMGSSMMLQSNKDISDMARNVIDGTGAEQLATSLNQGLDPLGEAYMECNSSEERRGSGSTYTPYKIVSFMVQEARKLINPTLIVDCGCGSGRYALACARTFPRARILAIDNSDEACEMCRANVVAAGLEDRVEIVQADFTEYDVPRSNGPILWIGNPPYVRHHDISSEAKERFKTVAKQLGYEASGLSGLHVHFLSSIARQWRKGDAGILITSAEWLDVNYGRFPRRLLTDKLGLRSVILFDKESQAFAATETTSVIFSFGGHVGSDERVELVSQNGRKRNVPVSRFQAADRWSPLVEDIRECVAKQTTKGKVPLGTLMGVHRGVVTGNNRFWVRKGEGLNGVPRELTIPVISHAKELITRDGDDWALENLGRLIVLPEDMSILDERTRAAAETIIRQGELQGIDTGYVARHRRRWWSINPVRPPAVMMTYMGRRRPKFVINGQGLSMLNVVHGLYPKVSMSQKALERLVVYLNGSVSVDDGRTYCGGLVKFEPKEAEAIMVPSLTELEG